MERMVKRLGLVILAVAPWPLLIWCGIALDTARSPIEALTLAAAMGVLAFLPTLCVIYAWLKW